MSHHGLLLTLTEPPPGMEEEFNAWYDQEHLPERLAIPGFLSARRWVADCAPGEGRYLATYELASPEVLQSAPYLARFQNQTPWSKRCLGKAVVFRRWACEQLVPGQAGHDPGAAALVLVAGDADTRSLAFPEALRSRHFRDPKGAPPCVALFDLPPPGQSKAIAPGSGWLVRSFRAYR